jgi:hypothetical protein
VNSFEEYPRRVRALVETVRESIGEDGCQTIDKLIEHNECASALVELAWAVVNNAICVDDAFVGELNELIAGWPDAEFLPPDFKPPQPSL